VTQDKDAGIGVKAGQEACEGGSKTGSEYDGDRGDWRRAILEHLQNPGATEDQKVRRHALSTR
jgi:hypothetical protein